MADNLAMRDSLPSSPRRAQPWACRIAEIVTLAAVLALPATAPAMDMTRHLPPPGASYVAEEVRVEGPGRCSLGGTLTLPTRGVLANGRILRYPAIVLLSDARNQDRDGVDARDMDQNRPTYRPLFDLADTLTQRGIAVMRLDDRGVGASMGMLDSTTIFDRTGDARAAIDYLRRRGDVDPQRIAVLGMSEGALIATMVAASEPDVRAVVLMARPAAPDREIAQFARTVSAPALVVQGDADAVASPDGANDLVAALRATSRDVTLRRLPGFDHSFLRSADFVGGRPVTPAALGLSPTVRGTVADWLATRLGGAIEGPAPHVSKRRLHRHRRR
jgi:alpha/beta superfamily hydrolase